MPIHDYFETQGSGAPILFIHGSYASTSTWKKFVERLSPSHQCISVKLPGHCGLPDPDDMQAPTIETELHLIQDIIAATTNKPVHIVGHSYGGVVAFEAAINNIIPLRKMTLFEPVTVSVLDLMHEHALSEKVKTFLAGYLNDIAANVPYACGQLIDFWGGQGSFASLPENVKAGMAKLTENNVRHWKICSNGKYSVDDIEQLQVPTQIVCGNHSHPAAHCVVSHLQQRIPVSRQYTVEGASHFLVTSHSDACLDILQDADF